MAGEQHNTTMDLPIATGIDSRSHGFRGIPRAKSARSDRTKRPSICVRMEVLGAIDIVEGRTRHERIHNVAQMTFLDEEGVPHRFTWWAIQTW